MSAAAKADKPSETVADLLRFGNADSTGNVDNAAEQTFDNWQEMRNEPSLKKLTAVHVEGENLHLLLLKYCRYLADTNIAKRNGQKGFLGDDSKVQYASKVKTLLSTMFPENQFFRNGEKAWSDMRKQLVKRENRGNLKNDETEVKRTAGLYEDLEECGSLVRIKDLGTNIIDLKTIITR